jgi:hypothetical protein
VVEPGDGLQQPEGLYHSGGKKNCLPAKRKRMLEDEGIVFVTPEPKQRKLTDDVSTESV